MLFIMHGMLLYLHKVCFKWNDFKDFSAWTQLTHFASQTKVVGWNLHETENSSFFYFQGDVRLSPNLAWSSDF